MQERHNYRHYLAALPAVGCTTWLGGAAFTLLFFGENRLWSPGLLACAGLIPSFVTTALFWSLLHRRPLGFGIGRPELRWLAICLLPWPVVCLSSC